MYEQVPGQQSQMQQQQTSGAPATQTSKKGPSWSDALIGLAQFIAATQRNPPQAPGINMSGIGRPGPAGPLSSQIPLTRPRTLTDFL